jgi:hypothetical protein
MWAKQNRGKKTSDDVRFAAALDKGWQIVVHSTKKVEKRIEVFARHRPFSLLPRSRKKKRDSFSSSLVVDEGLWLVHIKTKSRPHNSQLAL